MRPSLTLSPPLLCLLGLLCLLFLYPALGEAQSQARTANTETEYNPSPTTLPSGTEMPLSSRTANTEIAGPMTPSGSESPQTPVPESSRSENTDIAGPATPTSSSAAATKGVAGDGLLRLGLGIGVGVVMRL